MSKLKSPLKGVPLRVPGQSVDQQIDRHFDDHLAQPLFMIMVCLLLVGCSWLAHFGALPKNPWYMTIGSIPFVIGAFIWLSLSVRRAKTMILGRDGERAVGQFLERFRADGFQIYHDVQMGDANIDHVLIGPHGVFTVETKTLSKPVRGDARIVNTPKGITANNCLLTRNPIVQAKAQAGWLKNYFADAGFKISVQPVVVFPGWFVEPADFSSLGVWILEPKALPSFIENADMSVAPETAKALSLCLSNYIRNQSRL